MIKQLDATITFSTMKWVFAHTSLADMAEILEQLIVEGDLIFYGLLVQNLGIICGVDARCSKPYQPEYQRNNGVRKTKTNLQTLTFKGPSEHSYLNQHQACVEGRQNLIKGRPLRKAIAIHMELVCLSCALLLGQSKLVQILLFYLVMWAFYFILIHIIPPI